MPSPETTPRRKAVQARGQRRVDEILDAAAALIAEVGYDALTLTAVAQRADCAIGSVYRFFADKDELVAALVDRLAEELRALEVAVLSPDLARAPLEDVIDHIVGPVTTFAKQHPELGQLVGNVQRRATALQLEIERRLTAILEPHTAPLRRAEAAALVQMTMAMVRGAVQTMATASPAARTAASSELRFAMRAYLTSRLALPRLRQPGRRR